MNRNNRKYNTAPTKRANLPTVLTSFIGRKRELAEVERLSRALNYNNSRETILEWRNA